MSNEIEFLIKMFNQYHKTKMVEGCECYTKESLKWSDAIIIAKMKGEALKIALEKRLNLDEVYHKEYEWYMIDHKDDDASLIPTAEEYDLLKRAFKYVE